MRPHVDPIARLPQKSLCRVEWSVLRHSSLNSLDQNDGLKQTKGKENYNLMTSMIASDYYHRWCR